MKFVWDIEKEKNNIHKHKVTFSEAGYIFADKYSLTMFDNEHSDEEDRWLTLGLAPSGKILVVAHTYRKVDDTELVRIISARKATKSESKQYFGRRK